MRTLVKDVAAHAGEQITVAGFVQVIRDQGSIKFLVLRDVSGTVQYEVSGFTIMFASN